MTALSSDHLVGLEEERRGNSEARGLGGLQVKDRLECGRLFHRKVSRLLALQSGLITTT
jgi:hypothetical protein